MAATVAATAPERRVRPRLEAELVPVALFAVFVLAMGAFLLHEGRGTTFYFDEWSLWSGRHGLDPDKWLAPINGHLFAVPILAFTAITKVFGAEDLLPYRIAGVGAHLMFLVLVFAAARPRVGSWAALIAIVPVGVVAAGWLVIAMPSAALFAIGPLIGGVGAYLLLRRRTPRADAGATLMLVLGLACGGLGIAVVAAGVVVMAADPGLRRRAWVAVVPLLLYGLWRTGYGVPSELAFWDLGLVPSYVARGLASGVSAYLALPDAWGPPLAVVLLLAVAWGATRRTAPLTILGGVLAVAAGYWALIALARGPELGPEEVRYVYGNAFLVLLIALTVVPRVRAPAPVMAVATAVAALFLMAQLNGYRGKAAEYRQTSALTKADLFAFRALEGVVAPEFTAPSGDPQASAGAYLNARRFWGGPPGLSEQEVLASPAEVRNHVDSTFAQGARLELAAVSDPRAVARGPLSRPATVGAADVRPVGDCWSVGPPAADVSVGSAQGGGILVQTGREKATVTAARYFDEPFLPLGAVPARSAGSMVIPPDRARTPWRLRVASQSPVRLCGVRAP